MLWGLTLFPGNIVRETVEYDVHLSMAALETRQEYNANPDGQSQVIVQTERGQFVVCTLVYGSLLQQALDMEIKAGEMVTLFSHGKGVIHLTGNACNVPTENPVQGTHLNKETDEVPLEHADGQEEETVGFSEDEDGFTIRVPDTVTFKEEPVDSDYQLDEDGSTNPVTMETATPDQTSQEAAKKSSSRKRPLVDQTLTEIKELNPNVERRMKIFRNFGMELGMETAENRPALGQELEAINGRGTGGEYRTSSSPKVIRKEFELDSLKFNVKEVLEEDVYGRQIVAAIENGQLSGRLRKKMVQILVSHLMNVHGEKPRAHIKLQLAKQIIEEFPLLKTSMGEGYEAFYTPGTTKRPATGFLEMRLRNVRRRDVHPKRRIDRLEEPPVTGPAQIVNDLPANEVDAMVAWLKINNEPEAQVRDYMKKTAPARLQELQESGDPRPVLLKYPRLLDTPGIIGEDFDLLYPGHGKCLYEKWTTASSRRVMDWATLQSTRWEKYLALPYTLTEEETTLAALHVLPLSLPTGMRATAAGKRIKLSKAETVRAFIDCQPVETNLPQYLEEKENEGTRKHPYILVLGDKLSPSEQFVVIERTALPCSTTLAAVDACFKAFHVLKMEFPSACKAVWQFFQHGCYSIPSSSSDVNASVRSLVTAFNVVDR